MNFDIGGYKIKLVNHSDVWMPTSFARYLGEIIAEEGPAKKVLELGVGSGVLTVLCGLRGSFVHGLDINPAALLTTKKAWEDNSLPTNKLRVSESDLFSALRRTEKGTYDLLISNPPTFPAVPLERHDRTGRDAWEFAGHNGREVLDAVITQGNAILKPGGRLLTIATSRQSWHKTIELMDNLWGSRWKILKQVDIPLAAHYKIYVEKWIKKGRETGENLIHSRKGQWYQTLYFLKAWK